MAVLHPSLTGRRRRAVGRVRLAVSERLEARRLLSAFMVSTAADSGAGSLRQAILDSNANPGADTISFAIAGVGVQTITPLSHLPAITGPLFIDGSTQPGFTNVPLIQISGSSAGAGADGLDVFAGNSTIQNLIISNFAGNGIALSGAGGNLVQGNYIGTDPSGHAAAGNALGGIAIAGGSSSNQVNGNVISGNGLAQGNPGVLLSGQGTNSNRITGNLIGTDATGTQPLGNGGQGVAISNQASSNQIAGNTISANSTNYGFPGVEIWALGTNSNVLAGNKIGTDVTGTQPLGNGGDGVMIEQGAQLNQVGTNGDGSNDAAEGNVICANGAAGFGDNSGVQIDGANQNVVAGNFIGTNGAGAPLLGNLGMGVLISSGAQLNRVGANGADPGAAAERNVIANNGLTGNYPGVEIYGSNNNVVAGNYVGVGPDGLTPMGNGGVGVYILGAAQSNRVGTDGDGIGDALERNVISANLYQGVGISGPSTNANVVAGNYIGTNAIAGLAAGLGNQENGVWVLGGAAGNRIGANAADADAAGEANLIAGNALAGIAVTDTGTIGNAIRGNSIHNNGGLGIDLGADGFSASHGAVAATGPNEMQNHPVLLSGMPGAGTALTGTLFSTPGTYAIDFYADSAADRPFSGAGERWLGAITVTTDGSGHSAFSAMVQTASAGEYVTATATDSAGNTSEFSTPLQLPAQAVNAGGLGAGVFTPIGPSPIMETQINGPVVSGRVSVAAGDPNNPNVMYIGAVGGGIWKTTDWLDPIPHWTALTDSQPSLWLGTTSYTALAVAAGNSQIVYAAVSSPGGGILKSTDAGATWTELGTSVFNHASFVSLAVSPTDANTLYVSVRGGAADGAGVYKSTDGGQTWANTTPFAVAGAAADLAMNQTTPTTLYAGVVGAGSASGIYQTTDGGVSWTQLSNGVLWGTGVGVSIRLAIAPSDPTTVYATIFDPKLGDVPNGLPHRYATTDAGASWTALGPLTTPAESRYWNTVLSVDPSNASIVYINGIQTLDRSTDGGATWTSIDTADATNVSFDDAGALVLSGDRGIYRWTGGQSSFQNKQGDLQNTDFYTIALDPTDPNTMYGVAAGQTNSLKYSGNAVWTYTASGDQVGRIIVDPVNPSRIYEYDPNNQSVNSGANSMVLRSDDGGATFAASGTGIPTTPSGFNVAYGSQNSFVMDPSNHDRLLVATDTVYQTINDGTSWSAISSRLSPGQFITALRIAPSNGNVVYAATTDGKLFATSNLSTWQEADSGLPIDTNNRVMGMQVDPADPQHVIAVTGTYLGGAAGANHVFVTSNGGLNWNNVTGNLPPDDAAQTLAVDWRFATPRLYAGTLRGVFLSSDMGAHWTAFGGLPNTIVTDLELSTRTNTLVAATYGRGAFEIRVPTPLALLGDANEDGIVNLSDLLILVRHFGQSGQTWQTGDFNGDGVVNLADFLLLTRNFGATAPPAAPAASASASQAPVAAQPTSALRTRRVMASPAPAPILQPAIAQPQPAPTLSATRLLTRRV